MPTLGRAAGSQREHGLGRNAWLAFLFIDGRANSQGRANSHARGVVGKRPRLMRSGTAAVLVAHENAGLSGVAIVLFRRGSLTARLYSIAVAPHAGGRGLGPKLLEAAEAEALARGCRVMRLEVHHSNHAAIA